MIRPGRLVPWRAILVMALVTPSLALGEFSAGRPTPVGVPDAEVPALDVLRPATTSDEAVVGDALPDASDMPDAGADLDPTIEYEQALAHQSDPNTFVPGDAVEVGFVPVAGDAEVDGGQPLALPAGTASGAQMAAESNGDLWAGRAAGDLADDRATSVASVVAGDDITPVAFASRRPQVIGFLPYWKLASAAMRYDVLTTIAYFGVGVTPTGNLRKRNPDGTLTIGWAGWTSAHMSSIIRNGHRRHVRVVLTVQSFAWTAGQAKAQASVLASPVRRARLANEIAAAVRQRGADGVNLDFEPIAKGQSLNYVRFVRTLRAALNRYHRGYELTVDTTAYVANYDVARLTAPGAADAVVVMGYDYRTHRSAPGAVAPLASPGYDLRDTIASYRARTSASKIILALPWYGRAWSTASSDPSAKQVSVAKFGASVSAPYSLAVTLATLHGRHYLASEATAWTTYTRRVCTPTYGCVVTWRKLFYDDARSLGAKLSLLKSSHLRGTAIWALGYEGSRPELWTLYGRAFPKA